MNNGVKAYMESLGFRKRDDDYDVLWIHDDLVWVVNDEAATFFCNAQKEAVRKVLEGVKEQVIGDDDDDPYMCEECNNWDEGRNSLRDEQRLKLNSIIKDLGKG